MYQRFKQRVIAALPQNEPWRLTADEVAGAVEVICQELGCHCPLCGDDGTLWREQLPEGLNLDDTFCSCAAGRARAGGGDEPCH